MEEFLRSFEGKKVDIYCGAGSFFSGRLEDTAGAVICLTDSDDRKIHIAADKVIAVRESFEAQSRPGFIA
jgi:hypothetical protein